MRLRKRLLFVALLGIWVGLANQGVAAANVPSHVCDTVCANGATCDAECWLTQWDFDEDHPSTTCGNEGYDCCGDGSCNPQTEGCNACTDDCGYVPSCEPYCTSNAQCP